jgi:bacterioferritin
MALLSPTRFNQKIWTRFRVSVVPRRRRVRPTKQSPLSFRRRSPIVESTGRELMAKPKSDGDEQKISRDRLAELLNEDLSREYQAIISYVVYSQVLKGAEFMSIAGQLEVHAQQELKHALIISKQIDYLGKMPAVTPKPVRTSEKAKDMLRFDLDNENETIKNYRARVRQCEALGEFAMAELIRQILVDEQDHQIDLATALGVEVPDVSA